MNRARFDALVMDTVTQMQTVLCAKSDEYSRGKDALHNFKRAANVTKSEPERALLGMEAKHRVSLLDIVDDICQYNALPSKALIDEKIHDSIGYLLLLKALIYERIETEEKRDG